MYNIVTLSLLTQNTRGEGAWIGLFFSFLWSQMPEKLGHSVGNFVVDFSLCNDKERTV